MASSDNSERSKSTSPQTSQTLSLGTRVTLDEIISRARLEKDQQPAQARIATALRALSW